jgi:peptidoglycan/LPS O-acetylase OafA/YrhL
MHAPQDFVTARTDYRPDIDGLRAIAVLLVLTFHLGFRTFSGGYVGVDVFFVISGFLITQLIRRDVAADKFTFAGFYIRRCRRILPSLFFTLALSFVVAFLVFAPEHMEPFSGSLVAAVLSISNIFFWNHSSYFDVSSKVAPLLHTWSLGVEEQFYIFYPLVLLFFLRQFRGKAWIALLVVGLMSFEANLMFVDGQASILAPWPTVASLFSDGPTTIFYLAPFRAFEFAIGAVLTFAPSLRGERSSDAVFLIGAGLIAYSAVVFTEHTIFPSWNALVPCLGAAALIWTDKSRLSRYAVGNSVFAYLGRISYSVYLIHWPIIVFYTYVFSTDLSLLAAVVIGVVSFAAGSVMHRFVEQPFRNPSNYQRGAFRFITAALAGATIALAVVANVASLDGGFPWRLSPEAMAMLPDWTNRGDIMGAIGCTGPCEFGNPKKKTILVVGDSYVDQYTKALKSMFGEEYHFKEAEASSCYIGEKLISHRWGKPNAACQTANDQARIWLSDGSIAAVIHSQFWEAYHGLLVDSDGRAIKFKSFEDLYQRQIADLKMMYANYNGPVIIVGSSVIINLSCYRRPTYLNLPCPSLANQRAFNQLFAKEIRSTISTWPQMRFVDPEDIICTSVDCLHVAKNGSVLYTDIQHLSFEGAKIIVPHIMGAVDQSAEDQPR